MDRRLSRRRLLGGAVGAAAAGVSGPLIGCSNAEPKAAAASKGRIVVLGGGLAGLTAAYELEQAGYEAQVVEARHRLGGRVVTLRGFEGGQHAEAGGEYVDSHHRPLRELCDRFELELEDARLGFGGLTGIVFRDGRAQVGRDFRTPAVERTTARFWRQVAELAAPLQGANPTAHGGAAQDRRTAADLLNEVGVEGRARFLLESKLRDDYGLDADQISLLYLTISERIAQDQPSSGVEAFRIRGGSSRLVEALARRLVTPPMIGSPAAEVRRGASGVEVVLNDGEVIEGDRLVLAAPPPALRRIDFSPALPRTQAEAIKELDCCPVTKTVVQYQRRVWHERGLGGYAATDLPIGSTWEATDQQPGSRGILIAYAAGGKGEEVAALGDVKRIKRAKSEIDDVFAGTGPVAGRAFTMAWPNEAYSRGAWVAYKPGQITRHWLALHDPVGPIHMAGEHTEVLSGYMNSAVASGLRVAREISAS